MTAGKAERIRDPVHNLITFGADTFDQMLWRIIETPPFQRLRRIRQLGFSEFVFSGATHTRFAHSIGVLHTARQLMRVIERLMGDDHHPARAHTALAAALVHDVGHGTFSHAFEEIGRTLKIELANHEVVSERIIRDSEITKELNEWSPHFADDVADLVARRRYSSLYDSVVSSQFDADRLDYMQRDRMMTGVESSRVDVSWLLANLEIASVSAGADDQPGGIMQTLMLGPKAYYVAEAYVLALFQLYPNVYFHKTTRGAEKVFCDLMLRLIALVEAGDGERTGLPKNHPICRFAEERTSLARVMALDDAVFWGAVPLLMEAKDRAVADRARRLWHRDLPKCIDVRLWLEEAIPPERGADQAARTHRAARIGDCCEQIAAAVSAQAATRPPEAPPLLIDQVKRAPYKKFQDSKSLLNQILIRHGTGTPMDMADLSPVVASAESFEVCRVYVTAGDTDSRTMVENIMRTCLQGETHGNL